jgi:hypothetical protein
MARSETVEVRSDRIRVPVRDAGVNVTVTNHGPDTLYYGGPAVSSVSNDGTLAKGASQSVSSDRYYVSALKSHMQAVTPEDRDLLLAAYNDSGGAGSSLPDGGTTDQVLVKLSSTNGDAGWATPAVSQSDLTAETDARVAADETLADADTVLTAATATLTTNLNGVSSRVSTLEAISIATDGELATHAAGTSAVHGLSSTAAIEGVVVSDSAAAARPTGFASIKWINANEPDNAVNKDTWIDTTVGSYKILLSGTWVSLPGSAPSPDEMPDAALTSLSEFELGDQDAGGATIEDMVGGGIRGTVDTASAIQAYCRAMTAAPFGEGDEFWITLWGTRKTSGYGLLSRFAAVDNFNVGDDNVVRVEVQSNNRLFLVCSRYSSGADWTGLNLDSGVNLSDGVARKIECRVVLSDTTSGVGEIYVNNSLVAQGTGKTNEASNNGGALIKARVGVTAINNTIANPDVVHEIEGFQITATRQ